MAEPKSNIILIIIGIGFAAAAFAMFSGRTPPAANADNLPTGMLHYDNQVAPQKPVEDDLIPCYAGATLTQFLDNNTKDGYHLVSSGDLPNGDTLRIYSQGLEKSFMAVVVGPDRSGIDEGCQVATGHNYHVEPSAP